jgi:hypothetical protein
MTVNIDWYSAHSTVVCTSMKNSTSGTGTYLKWHRKPNQSRSSIWGDIFSKNDPALVSEVTT